MTRAALLAFSLFSTTPAFAAIELTFSFTPTAYDSDTFGLDGSTLTFSVLTTQETYGARLGPGPLTVTWESLTLSVSGSTSSDGTYDLVSSNGDGLFGVFSTGSTNLLLTDSIGIPTFDVGSAFRFYQLQLYSNTTTFTKQAGDTISASDFADITVNADNSTLLNLQSAGGGNAAFYTFTPFTVSAANVVPEPSTYAALAGLATLGFVALRRKRG